LQTPIKEIGQSADAGRVSPCVSRQLAPSRAILIVLLAVMSLVALAGASTASADVAFDKRAPDRVLFGKRSTVTLHASNTAPYAYNLTFRDVLPAGVSYVAGSSTVEPRIIQNAPVTGQTTLIFENVSDLSPGSEHDLTYETAHSTSTLGIGDQVSLSDAVAANDAGAYVNSDPRTVPKFDALGQPTGGATSSATDQTETRITAVEIEKSEPSPEGELLRGAHDHQTVYSLNVTNNDVRPTTTIRVEDYLPAGLEYLACGTGDNTTDAPTNAGSTREYRGAEALNPGNAPAAPDCLEPSSVETVDVDPDGASGPLPKAVYTHVVWNSIGTLAAGASRRIQYVAAIPLRENTLTWGAATPSPASLDQGSNLDNNRGAETRDEQALTNYATAAGDYDGTLPVQDDARLTRTAEDLAIQKAASSSVLEPGALTTWTLQLQTSEYRRTDDLVITDELPNGLCPLGPSNEESTSGDGRQSECDPTGAAPSAPYTAVTEQSDGTFDITWDKSTYPDLARVAPSSRLTLTFPTRSRQRYQSNFTNAAPVLTGDRWTNRVDVAGDGFRICAPGDPLCAGVGTPIPGEFVDGTPILDESSAGQRAGGVTIDKTVLDAPANARPIDCATGAYVGTGTSDYTRPAYGPGDRICWQLRVDFATKLFTGNPTLRDFLPPGVVYDPVQPPGAGPTANNTVSASMNAVGANDPVLEWTLGSGSTVDENLVFEWRIATRYVGGTTTAPPVDVPGNLMKLSYANTEGQTFPLRDRVEYQPIAAQLGLVKGVRQINGTGTVHPPNRDNLQVKADDAVTYRVDLTNTGAVDALDAVVWDNLPAGITCADIDVMAISDGGTCGTVGATTAARITWTGVDVGATGTPTASRTLTYTLNVPDGVNPSRNFDNEAGVVRYESETNTTGDADTTDDRFVYVPANNIDPTATGTNAAAARDGSRVSTRAVVVSKGRTTTVTETGNAAGQATVGERIDYALTAVVPDGTTVYGDPALADPLGSRQTLATSPAVEATLNGGALPAGFSVDTSGNAVRLVFPTSYENAPDGTDDVFTVKFSAVVDDVAANQRGGTPTSNWTLPNVGTLSWRDEPDGTARTARGQVTTTIVEPNLKVAKTHVGTGKVKPADTVTYTVTATNPNTAPTVDRVTTAHDVRIVDTLPVGVTPVLSSIGNGGVWDGGARTITWTAASLAPNGTPISRSYDVTIDDPATAGSQLTNAVQLDGTSLAGTTAGERSATTTPGGPVPGYRSAANDTVALQGATVVKQVAKGAGPAGDAATATVGDALTYTVDVRFPAGVRFFDTTAIDVLPDGVAYDRTVSATCVTGCGSALPVATLPPTTAADGRTTLAWFVGDLEAAPADRVVRIVYAAHVARELATGTPATPVTQPLALTNTVDALYNGADEITGTPAATPARGTFDEATTPDTARVDIVEPRITIDKNVSGDADGDDARTTQPGDDYTYELLVRNTGDAPAYDVDVTDALDEERLRDVVLTDGAARATDADATDGSLRWTIPGPIAPGDTVTLRYTAKLAPSAALTDADTVVNTADVARYWGVPKTERDADGFDYREYTDVPADTVTLTVALPTLQVEKTTGGSGFPEQADTQVGEETPWRVVVRNTSTIATAHDVAVRDVLPAHWEYVAGSASIAPAPPTGTPSEPGGGTTAGVRTMTWADIGDLAPGGQVVLTMRARPTAAAIGTPGSGTANPNRNVVDVTAEDGSGATASRTGPYADDDDASAILRAPQLAVTKTPDGDRVTAGEDATYSVVVKNDGDAPARDVVVRDVLGAGQTYAAGTATAAPTTGFAETAPVAGPGTGETTVAWTIAAIPAGGSVTITVPVGTAPSVAKDATLKNGVAVTSREITTPKEDEGSLLVDTRADVRIAKDFAGPAVPGVPGRTVDFDLVVTNDGPSDARDVTVKDELPAGLSFDAFLTGGAECTTATAAGKETITCAAGTLAPNGTRTYTVRARIDSGWTTAITNVTTATTSTQDPTPANNTDDAVKTMGVEADLVVDKSAPTLPVPQGVEFDYAVTVTNQGASDAVDVGLHDDMPEGVSLVRATSDHGTCAPGTGADKDDVDCALGTLKPGQVATITIRAKGVEAGTFTNVAKASTSSVQTSTSNDEDDAEVTVPPVADLQVVKTASATVEAGGTIRYALEATNNGPSDATGVTVTDPLPAGTEFVSADPGCALAGSTVTCAVGDLARGASKTLRLEVRAPLATAGTTLTNVATVDGDQLDLVAPNDSSQASTVVGPSADLSVAKTAGGAVAGGTASWTIAVRNDGPTAAEGVRVKDALPAGTTFSAATPSQGTCSAADGEVTCAFGTVPSGGSAQVTVVAGVDAGLTGRTLRNGATVGSDTPDPRSDNDTSSVDVVVEPAPPTPPARRTSPAAPASPAPPDLAVSKVASTKRPALGKQVVYRIAVTNHGGTTAKDVRLVDTMSGPARVDRVRASQGRCVAATGGPTCVIGELAPGGTATMTVDVTPTESGALRNTVSVLAAGQAEPTMSDNDAVAGVSVVRREATATLSKRASKRTVRGGGKVVFTMKATMGRGAAGENVRVCDRLPRGLVFVRAKGAAIRGTRACWNVGFLQAGSSRTFRITARAERSDTARRIRNVATLTGRNVAKRSAAATVRVRPATAAAAGGVTG
jgi:uncharacterized repeat protein (TIGR01451 family)/fimbrial isopeptide formation D2 family protein